MNMVSGTAGHVDHGKTELIEALTGRNTDRLEEEQRRGISIVLGFAPLDLGEDLNVGVVDVPGHERFVKTMVSGAVGVDMALLVVAADEGVMPQTTEHMEVLRLLGVKKGVVAVTKIDLVDEETVEFVEEEVREFTRGTFLEGAPVVRTSVVTGEGIERLREVLRETALGVSKARAGDFFRMPIDRIFTLQGIGTIVAGTTWSGEVRKGDELVIEPEGRTVRVRDVQSFDRSLDRATAGLRTALAIHGVKKEELTIGDQVLTPGVLAPSSMLNAFLEVSPIEGARVKTRQRVRFHHAGREILGRIVIIGSGELGPGDKGFVQLRLEEPAVAMKGDRFVIRSYSPMRVIAGGVVLEPVAVKAREKHFAEIAKHLDVMQSGTPGEIVREVVAHAPAIGIERSELRRYGLSLDVIEDAVGALVNSKEIVAVGSRLFSGKLVSEKRKELKEVLEAFMRENRLRWGMEREELRSRLGLADSPLFDYLIEDGLSKGELFVKASQVRAGSESIKLTEEEAQALKRIEDEIEAGGFKFLTEQELLGLAGDKKKLAHSLKLLQERGSIVRISGQCYMHARHYGELLRKAHEKLSAGGAISVGEFKEMFGFTRKYAVPVLEHLDGVGFTKRVENERVAGHRMKEVMEEFLGK